MRPSTGAIKHVQTVTKARTALIEKLGREPTKDEIATNYPVYRTPPPGDDARPNETSWTYFKKAVESGKVKPAR